MGVRASRQRLAPLGAGHELGERHPGHELEGPGGGVAVVGQDVDVVSQLRGGIHRRQDGPQRPVDAPQVPDRRRGVGAATVGRLVVGEKVGVHHRQAARDVQQHALDRQLAQHRRDERPVKQEARLVLQPAERRRPAQPVHHAPARLAGQPHQAARRGEGVDQHRRGHIPDAGARRAVGGGSSSRHPREAEARHGRTAGQDPEVARAAAQQAGTLVAQPRLQRGGVGGPVHPDLAAGRSVVPDEPGDAGRAAIEEARLERGRGGGQAGAEVGQRQAPLVEAPAQLRQEPVRQGARESRARDAVDLEEQEPSHAAGQRGRPEAAAAGQRAQQRAHGDGAGIAQELRPPAARSGIRTRSPHPGKMPSPGPNDRGSRPGSGPQASLDHSTRTTTTSTEPAGRSTSTASPSRRPSSARPSGASTLMSPAATSNSSGPTSR